MSQRSVPIVTAEPSASGYVPTTVPVPYVVSPTIVARPASLMAPVTISAELAVWPFTRSTSGIVVAIPPPATSCGTCLPLRSCEM